MANPFGVQRPVAAVPQMGSTLIPPRRRVLAHLAENPELLRELYAEADNPFSQGANSPEALYYKLFAGKSEGLADLMIGSSPGAILNWRADPGQVTNSLARTGQGKVTNSELARTRPRAGRHIPRSRRNQPEVTARTARPVERDANLAAKLRDRIETVAKLKRILGGSEAPLGSDEVLLAMERLHRDEGRPVLVDKTARAVEYAKQLLGDMALSTRIGLVKPENRDFYHRAAQSWKTTPPEVGRLGRRSGALSAFTEDALSDPDLINLFSAMSVPYSAQATPYDEAMIGMEMIPYFLERLASSRGGNAPAMEAMFGKERGVPTGAAWGRPGTFDRTTGKMTRWSKPGESLFDANAMIARLIDEQGGSAMHNLRAASKWLERPQSLDELRRLQGEELLANAQPWAKRAGGSADLIPQSLTMSRLPHWPEGKFQTDLPGWFVMGPKKGPYAEMQSKGTGKFAVFDEQATRGLGMRLGGNFLVNGDPISDTDLANLIEMVAKKRDLGKPWSMEQIIGGPKFKNPEFGKRVMVRNQPGGIKSGEREFYQSAMMQAAEELGLDVGQIQAEDWFLVKQMLEAAGSDTPMKGGVAEGHAEVLKRTKETGTPFVERGKKELSARDVYEYEKKGKLTPTQANAAAKKAGYPDFSALKAALDARGKK